jgi:NAD(P)-dependent dehydrogenase (short-subunit alcohol dehydrogenase family)
MAERFVGKVALVTGASRGIGKATALRFAAEGASIAVHFNQNAAAADEVCEEIASSGGTALAVQGDLGDTATIPAIVARVLDEFERIDILVNNAGIFLASSLADSPLEELDQLLRVNVVSIVALTGAVVPGMIERRYGKIINLTSVAALATSVPGTSGYGVSKAAVIAATRRTAFELGPHNINVNAIAPGLIRTDMGLPETDPAERAAKEAGFAAHAVLGRIGEPDDIAHAACFLASEESAFITGQVLVVDGGRTNYFTHSV